ncbi:uncharacterized protein LOC123507795 isoform X2 [Portunus trituberculatus]|uniref:uncharacterized protein LOC123507795 isoform X2 n=1 Tax=Portunus trituberculatus TaxID=210409 RepID=UPI001E1D0CD7|nr:uncharacterized protein LOC123507795 isoform X2 [Portunus trituberculatus]
MDLDTVLLNTTMSLLTTEAPNTTHDTGGDNVDPHGGVIGGWVLWVIVSGSLFCFTALAVTAFVLLVVLPRRGYERIEGRKKQMRAFTQLLEEMRGRPRRVEPEESLTESERHFLIHDFADFP